MTDIIAERVFETRGDSPVVARLHAPRRVDGTSEWSCKIEIAGLEEPYDYACRGVDSFQALELGLSLICARIDETGATLTFLGGPEGDAGMPLIIPWSSSPSLKAEMYRLIDKTFGEKSGGREAMVRRIRGTFAERQFETRAGTPVVARIYAPLRRGESSAFSCAIEVEGLEVPFAETSVGVDSFQALYTGLRQLCAHIDNVATTLTFFDRSDWDAGTPLIVPWSFSPSLKAEVYRLIVARIQEELEAGR